MEYSDQEKRIGKRIKRPFLARIRLFREKVKPGESRRWDIVIIRDVSSVGICFNYNKQMQLGVVIEFNITLPFSAEPVNCLGKVIRVDKNHTERTTIIRKAPIYGIAARFISIEDDKKAAINKFAKEYYSK